MAQTYNVVRVPSVVIVRSVITESITINHFSGGLKTKLNLKLHSIEALPVTDIIAHQSFVWSNISFWFMQFALDETETDDGLQWKRRKY